MESRVGWQSSPSARGTLDIVWGAFVTLALCVWTAVHPNIQLESSQMHDLGVRLLMMVVAVIFPEILISAAWHQRVLAHKLATPGHRAPPHPQQAATSQEELPGQEKETRNDEWTRTQAFFVVMGGFAIEHPQLSDTSAIRGVRSILTVDGIQLMRRAGFAPKLTKADIDERSNADIIAKLIVVLQVVWFAIQIVARLVSHLAVTALEIHTIVHVGCAIIMYVLWWDKPYAVSRSVVLQDKRSRVIGNLFLFNNLLHEKHEQAVRSHEIACIRYWEQRAVAASGNLIDHDPPPEAPRIASISQALATYTSVDGEGETQSDDQHERMLRLIAKDALAGLRCISDQYPEALTVLEQPAWRGVRQTSENFTLRQVWGSWTTDIGHEMSMAKAMHFLFNLLYGGGHLAAWDSSTFPTTTEAWIWRISALLVASLFSYGSVWVLFWTATRSRSRWALPFRRGDANFFMGPFFCAVILGYVCARCYFFVEALISLRSLPTSAYQTLQWSNLLPHSS